MACVGLACASDRQEGCAGALIASGVQFYANMRAEEVTQEFLWGRLEPAIGHLDKGDRATLWQALDLAMRAHAGQVRKSGEPFITHPVEVTRILGEINSELVCPTSPLLVRAQ